MMTEVNYEIECSCIRMYKVEKECLQRHRNE